MAIKYGFFDAIRGLDEEQHVVYDRAYTADDHNEYLNGLISRNGVFKSVEQEFKIIDWQESNDSITFVDPDTGTEVTYDGYIAVNIGKGKAIVNGHWVLNDSQETLYLHKRDISAKRIDMISLRWRQDQRDVILVVTEGNPNSMASVPNNVGLPTQLGHIDDPSTYWAAKGLTPTEIENLQRSTDYYFDPVDSEQYGSTCEICLGFVDVPARNASTSTPKIYSELGSDRCPYIANLVTVDAKTNAMAFVANYEDAIKEWWEDVVTEGNMVANLTTIRHRISGSSNHGNLIYISGEATEIPEYSYQVEDTVNLYYNGLYMDEGTDYEIKVNDAQTFYIELKSILTISGENSLSIEIYKGTAMTIPDGSLIKY